MKKQHVDHVLHAAGRITGEKEFVIVGSQSLHGRYPDIADDIVRSVEIDLIATKRVDRTEWLNAIGQDSHFHETFGYYAARGLLVQSRLLELLEMTSLDASTRERVEQWDTPLRCESCALETQRGSKTLALTACHADEPLLQAPQNVRREPVHLHQGMREPGIQV